MYNNSYNDYIRSVLGYPNYNENDFSQNIDIYDTYTNDRMYNIGNQTRNFELEEYYPEIYKIVYPSVKKMCQSITGNVSKDKIDSMVNELYSNIEGNEQIQTFNRNIEDLKKDNRNNKGETRQFNSGLSDIIRILLLRELIGRPCGPGRPCNRPPFPPPGRPPYFY